MLLLRDRRTQFEQAGVRVFGASRDSPWSHVAWGQALDLGGIQLLSDWNGEAVRGFDIGHEYRGLRNVTLRSAFLVDGTGIIRGSWRYQSSELPDFDELLSAARSL